MYFTYRTPTTICDCPFKVVLLPNSHDTRPFLPSGVTLPPRPLLDVFPSPLVPFSGGRPPWPSLFPGLRPRTDPPGPLPLSLKERHENGDTFGPLPPSRDLFSRLTEPSFLTPVQKEGSGKDARQAGGQIRTLGT